MDLVDLVALEGSERHLASTHFFCTNKNYMLENRCADSRSLRPFFVFVFCRSNFCGEMVVEIEFSMKF